MKWIKASLLLFLLLEVSLVRAEDLLLAVASNFAAPMDALSEQFEEATGHRVEIAYGSSGRLYAQISNGAPFQLFFSADQDKPARLLAAGLAVADSRFTYAVGALLLWSADANLPAVGPELLRGDFTRLAIANPTVAPYGQAALEVLHRLDMSELVASRVVRGENIAQTFQFVETGNAQLGFVAQSQVLVDGVIQRGSGWLVPTSLHQPIRQDAVLLSRASDCQSCRAFLVFMQSAAAQATIASFGYQSPPSQ